VIEVMVAGALSGLGVLMLVLQLIQRPVAPGVGLARLDADRAKRARETSLVADRQHQGENQRLRHLGDPVVRALADRDIRLTSLTSDLAIVGRSLETHVGLSVLAAVGGFVVPTVLGTAFGALAGLGVSSVPLLVGVVAAVVGALVPTLTVRSRAADRRRDFRHVLGSFLDLVAMNLAGGRGVPEALGSAAGVSNGWAMLRLRGTLENARLQGVTPWAALGELGDALDVDELRDLAAALSLVAEDGAKVRESLAARAASMRTRELADSESRAQANSQSMLVAQLLLCVGFLVFLTYPALVNVLG
jgi:tight adherence protein C